MKYLFNITKTEGEGPYRETLEGESSAEGAGVRAALATMAADYGHQGYKVRAVCVEGGAWHDIRALRFTV